MIHNFKLSVMLKDGSQHFVDTEHFTPTPGDVVFTNSQGRQVHLNARDYLPIKSLQGLAGNQLLDTSLQALPKALPETNSKPNHDDTSRDGNK